jgi:hypothetical protein
MKRAGSFATVVAALLLATTAVAQPPRQDAIWARSTAGAPIVLDGILNEPQWALAESKVIDWMADAGIPGSGWKPEGGFLPTDPTHATLKFLTVGNTLYMGIVLPDKSIGGSKNFNRFGPADVAQGSPLAAPAPTTGTLWWNNDPAAADRSRPGAARSPASTAANLSPPRTPAQIAA